MLRSLFSGISGLRSHQTMLDVTGNNIANVNTAGFKASATQFQDTLSQMTQGAGGPQATVGGTNPAQVGLGVQVAGISTNFTQGSSQATGRPTDLMISGDGFFVTRMGTETLYTRAGSFDFDASGRLVAPDGAVVQGWTAVNGQIPEGGAVGNIMRPTGAVSAATASSLATMTGNLPSESAEGVVLNRDVQIFDKTGNSNTLTLTFTRTANGWDVTGKDSTMAPGATPITVGSLAQNADGTLTATATTAVNGIAINLAGLGGFAGMNTASMTADGRKAGSLESFSLGSDGTLIGSFSNGDVQSMGRIALANFINPPGLEKAGSSSYRATVNSGAAGLGAPGSQGLGSLVAGALEMSNVDLSQEFTNLIVAQRGFQANARIITTSDEVLQELTNLKR